MDLFTAVELFTQVIAYLMIVAGFPPCISMLKTKITKGVPYPFFLAGIVNSVMSVGYGTLVNNTTVVQINIFATCCNIFYIAAFIFVSKSKRQPLTQLLMCAAIVLGIYLYITRIAHPSTSMDNLGVIMLMCTTVLLLTPLLAVKQCIKDKSAANLSVSMLVPGIMCSTSWFLYGFLLKDVYIYGPNLIGVLSFMCQLAALAFYGTKPTQRPHSE